MLLVKVLVETLARFWLKIAPPSVPEFPENELVATVRVPLESMAPPVVPAVAGAEFPVNVLALTESVALLWT